MNDQRTSRIDRILDLLVEEIEERIRAQGRGAPAGEVSASTAPAAPVAAPLVSPPLESVDPTGEQRPDPETEMERHPLDPEGGFDLPPMLTTSLHAARLMRRLALGLLVAVALINIPFNRHGTTLATAMPDNAAVVIRDGLVVKEEDDEEIYVFQGDQFRWISSLEAFEHYGFTWGDVRIVDDGFLDDFERGPSLHVLLKCRSSPHIYRLEGGEKRWIRDIAVFVAEGHVWEDVRFVSCSYLRGLADGETIPVGSGPPPQP